MARPCHRSGRVRQALFDMLLHHRVGCETLEGVHVLDVFAGTGAFGLEALSRGAAHACAYRKSHPTWCNGMNGVRAGHAIQANRRWKGL